LRIAGPDGLKRVVGIRIMAAYDVEDAIQHAGGTGGVLRRGEVGLLCPGPGRGVRRPSQTKAQGTHHETSGRDALSLSPQAVARGDRENPSIERVEFCVHNYPFI
jgi:hypothetical protein